MLGHFNIDTFCVSRMGLVLGTIKEKTIISYKPDSCIDNIFTNITDNQLKISVFDTSIADRTCRTCEIFFNVSSKRKTVLKH